MMLINATKEPTINPIDAPIPGPLKGPTDVPTKVSVILAGILKYARLLFSQIMLFILIHLIVS